MMTVSIAMATYNGEQHLERQLESIAAQTRLPAELVITDDGSDDRTLSVIGAFAKSAPCPVRVYRNNARLGYRANFMRAAGLCRSDLIAFSDQDDVWYPHKVARCVERFTDSDTLLVYHNADVVTDHGERIGSLGESYKEYVAEGQIVGPESGNPMSWAQGFTEVFRRSMVHLSGLRPMSVDPVRPSEQMAHDQWFFFLASVLGRIRYVKEPLAAYVQHGQNVGGWWPTYAPRKAISQTAFENNGDSYSHYANVLDRLASLLERITMEVDGSWRTRASAAAQRYRQARDVYLARSRIYNSASFVGRLSAFCEVLTNGGYTGDIAFDRRSLAKDFCLGIPLGPFLKPGKVSSPESLF